MTKISSESLDAVEAKIQRALVTGDISELTILGYGEITTVVLAETPEGAFACKRLPVFRQRDAALSCKASIDAYVAALNEAGLAVVENDTRLIERDDGTFCVYSVQPALDPATLGPNYFQNLSDEEGEAAFRRILDLLKEVVSPRLAPDGQLSNWVFDGDRILYLDVSSPFMRDEHGNNLLDWRHLLSAMPAPVRPIILRWVLPGILDNYHSLRGQIVDFLGNLRKEKLDRFTPRFLSVANEYLGLDPPITDQEIRDYYKSDAQTYAAVAGIRQADRWFQRNVLRRTYPFLLPPPVERNLY